MAAEKLVLPVSVIPAEEAERELLSQENQRLLGGMFLRLAQMCDGLSGQQSADALLLLSTCRNQWYAINAMYIEGRKWCAEGERAKYKGFGDALDQLELAEIIMRSEGLNQESRIQHAMSKAESVLGVAAGYLAEFKHKFELFFKHFARVHGIVEAYGKSLSDSVASYEFLSTFAALGSGPEGAELHAPSDPQHDLHLTRLLDWIAVIRPLTSLTRAYLEEVVGARMPRERSCECYLAEIKEALPAWRALGMPCPQLPNAASLFVPWVRPTTGAELTRASAQLVEFIRFGRQALEYARRFLHDLLPADQGTGILLPLKKADGGYSCVVGQQLFQRKQNMFVLITDMRNSLGDPYRAPELKASSARIIDHLRKENAAHSQTVYDDCRVLACDSLNGIAACILRLFAFFEIQRSEQGVRGIRMGLARGEMLFQFDGSVEDLLKAAPLDSSAMTIGRAARLMMLDSERFKSVGSTVLDALGNWGSDENLIFIDQAVYSALPGAVREGCRQVGIPDLRGLGPQTCWAVPISQMKFLVKG